MSAITKSLPRFAVVGHPNKGKSSIVSTLAQDDSVAISPVSGTTAANRIYPMSIDGEVLYELIDTPGFQRPRQVMQWLMSHSRSVADRADTLVQFVQQHETDKKFSAECQLLTPIIAGAGILYVVDGSTPYGPEYDAEMEILRWSGNPSMALINPIRNEQFVEQWQQALSQYFKIVRVFNATTADNEKTLKLLKGFAQLDNDFEAPLARAVNLIQQQQELRMRQSCHAIAQMLDDVMRYQIQRPFNKATSQQEQEAKLNEKYQQGIKEKEQICRRRVQEYFNYQHLQTQEMQLSGLDEDLFSKRSWQIFGLSGDQLLAAGFIGGAATGGIVDLAMGGTSLLLGSGIGGLIGGATAYFGQDSIANIKIIGMSVGNEIIRVGPSKNINLPFVMLARAMRHLELIHKRTHATRDCLEIDLKNDYWVNLSGEQRNELASIFKKMRDASQPDAALIDKLTQKLMNFQK